MREGVRRCEKVREAAARRRAAPAPARAPVMGAVAASTGTAVKCIVEWFWGHMASAFFMAWRCGPSSKTAGLAQSWSQNLWLGFWLLMWRLMWLLMWLLFLLYGSRMSQSVQLHSGCLWRLHLGAQYPSRWQLRGADGQGAQMAGLRLRPPSMNLKSSWCAINDAAASLFGSSVFAAL